MEKNLTPFLTPLMYRAAPVQPTITDTTIAWVHADSGCRARRRVKHCGRNYPCLYIYHCGDKKVPQETPSFNAGGESSRVIIAVP